MKRLHLLLWILLLPLGMMAGSINEQQARQIAEQFFTTDGSANGQRRAPAAPPQLTYTSEASELYVFNQPGGGWVIVAGDDGACSTILAYSDTGTFDYEKAPDVAKIFLRGYADGIRQLRQTGRRATAPATTIRRAGATESMEPLLKTTWNQTTPYNNLCPEAANGGMEGYGGRCPSGCVPVAIAQIMNYWQWPKQGYGKHTNRNTPTQTVDFTQSTYDWDNMLDSYAGEYNEVQAQAVARLMADVGCAMHTIYTGGESGTPDDFCQTAYNFLFRYFDYSPYVTSDWWRDAGINGVSYADWLKAELRAKRPVFCIGSVRGYETHAVVCDGFRYYEDGFYVGDQKRFNFFHINFGWGGQCDGYYSDDTTGLLTDAVGGAIGFSTAFIDYALTKFAEEAWRGRNDIYWRAYRAYYSKRAIPGLANGYRSSPQWYKLLYPIFEKPNQTSEEIKAQVDQIVDDYAMQFWRDENLILDYFYEVSGLPYSQGGGLNQGLKDEITSTFKQEILGDILPGVFQSISDKLYDKQYAKTRNELVKYAKMMNRVVALQFKDGHITGDKSQYAGCTVRFKDLPASLTDPEKWQCVLTDQGTGVIRFRLYPYTFEGVKPVMEVVDAQNKVVKQLTVAISTDPGRSIIDLNESNQKGFVLQSFEKEEVEYKHDVPILTPLVSSETGTPYVNIYTTYQGEQTDLCALPVDPSVFDKGIREAFEMYGNFEFNPNGTIKVDNSVLTVDGSFQLEAMQQRPQKGSGTFSVNYSNLVNRKTVEEVSAWWQNPDMSKIMLMWDAVLNATVKHNISGTFTFEWNNDKQGYVFQFKGNGNYDIAGQVYNWVSNVNPETGGYGLPNPGAQVTHTEGFTLKGNSEMSFDIVYKLIE